MKGKCFLLLALLGTGCDAVLERDIGDDAIRIIAPTPDVETDVPETDFVWEPLKGADSYRVLVVSPRFDRVERFWADTVLTGCRYTQALPPGDYQWSIRGRNSVFQTAEQAYAFRIVASSGADGTIITGTRSREK